VCYAYAARCAATADPADLFKGSYAEMSRPASWHLPCACGLMVAALFNAFALSAAGFPTADERLPLLGQQPVQGV
jgi:hypothetical protein